MNSSMFTAAELPPRKCEGVDTRNRAIDSSHVTAGECHQRNYRDEFHGNQMGCVPGSFRDMFPDMHEFHSEALYGAGHGHRGFAHQTCTCNGCQQPRFLYDDHDDHHRQSFSRRRYFHGMTGSSSPISDETGHPQSLCNRGCCGSVAMRRERSGLGNCMAQRTTGRSRSSLFADSLEFQRNAAAVDGMSNFPMARRELEEKNCERHTEFMANPPGQTKAPLKQVMLYGWHLMKPPSEGYAADPSTFSGVAIGGYRLPRMEDQDFFETTTVVERLERWKLRTSDGLEVGLMGMINIEKSIASGFSPSLVQCFMIGFPSAWVYMLVNMQKSGPKSSSSGMPSPCASPTTSSAGPPGITGNTRRGSLETPITPEVDLVQSILQSPLFTAGPTIRAGMEILGGCSTDATTPTSQIDKIGDTRKRPTSESHSPVVDTPLVDPGVAPADSFHSSDRVVDTSPDSLHSIDRQVDASPDGFHSSDHQVDVSPDVTEEKADAELDEELGNADNITHTDDVDVEVDQSCRVKVEGRPRARRKRFKISRNYYQRGKKRSSTKSNDEKGPPSSHKTTTNVTIPIEPAKDETDESQVVEETIEPPKKRVDRTKRNTVKSSSSLEGPESSVENSYLKTSRQTRKSIVPTLPSPKVADKSKVTEAFGLKRSLHGRVLVPPLATWRSQSIKYDRDGGIVAISNGFTASEDENCTGYYNFKPPADKGARTMQRKLSEAADKGSRKK